MQIFFVTTITALALANLPLLINGHMMFSHNSVWGLKTAGGGLETPLNRQTKNWLHHGQKKDNDNFLELRPGQGRQMDIVCGEAARDPENASSVCKTKADVHMGGGCALGIAYKDPDQKPGKKDFKIISVVHNCPTLNPFKHSFPIPANLPACKRCTCIWVWVPDPKSSADEMYMITFNCSVLGNNQGTIKGGRQPIWFGVDGGVKGGGSGRPMYKTRFPNGAQKIQIK